ncbi:MAG: DUF1517 domain-containing protein [Xenococcaceae cyanobacterium MO_167.B52]|nr:DUF1517 domain-containing protein [Xenococcaceae cyanobacterium MO_167.B52]
MFNRRNINLKLFLATVLIVIGTNYLNLSMVSHNLIAEININNQVLAYSIKNSPNSNLKEDEIIAKKSGGRSGGGSFKTRSAPAKSSSSSSSSPSSTKRNPSRSRSLPRNSSSPYNDKSSTYKSPPRRTSTSVTTEGGYPQKRLTTTSTSDYQQTNWYKTTLGVILFLLSIALTILLPIGLIVFLIYVLIKAFLKLLNRANSDGFVEETINRERDNNQVTVSQLQVALSSQADGVQEELSTLSLNVDTSTDEGLTELMRESVLILLRHDQAWNYVLAESNSLHVSEAETEFYKISFTERSKFSSESLSNIDGNVRTKETVYYSDENFPAYVIVTLILGTADDRPLFSQIYSEKQLKEVLLQLVSMRQDYLMKFELLWTPQKQDEYLTEDEFLLEYSNMIKLV